MASSTDAVPSVPVLLLKTRSSPTDAYEELFSTPDADLGICFDPLFTPVLEHRLDDAGIARLRDLLARRLVSLKRPPADGAYGGLIFTSQRAVEAFAQVVDEGDVDDDKTSWPHLQDVPIYSVGPATTRTLHAVPQQPPLQVVGEHTGNGEALAYFIREHYPSVQPAPATAPTLPPLLFLVGDKRRDIIPKVLMGEGASPRIQVDELLVYGTGVMPSFPGDFRRILDATKDRPARWVVVFSPSGCDSMLAGLGLLDPATGKARMLADGNGRTTYVATIGPTTQAYLRKTFSFDPDVCADEPSPAGILRGIARFMAAQTAQPAQPAQPA